MSLTKKESKFNVGHAVTIGVVVATFLVTGLTTWGAMRQQHAAYDVALEGKADKEVVEVQLEDIKRDMQWLKEYLMNQKP